MAKFTTSPDYNASGNDLDEFKNTLKELTAATNVVPVSSDEITFLIPLSSDKNETMNVRKMVSMIDPIDSKTTTEEILNHIDCRIKKFEEAERLPVAKLSPNSRFIFGGLRMETLKSFYDDESYLQDLLEKSQMAIQLENKLHLVAGTAMASFLRRAGIGGNAFNNASYLRTALIAISLQTTKMPMQLIVRQTAKDRVVFAAHSEAYAYVPQTVLIDIIDEITASFGRIECKKWYVDHNGSYAYITFPEMAADFSAMYGLPDKIEPGLYVASSDTGESSLIIRSIWMMKNYKIGGEEVKHAHKGNIDPKALIQEAYNSVYGKYNAVPERLAELLTIDVTDTKGTIKSVLKQIGCVSVIGKKRTMSLTEQLLAEFPAGTPVTAYNIATTLMELSERAMFTGEKNINLEAMSARAVFADYTAPADDDDDIILV